MAFDMQEIDVQGLSQKVHNRWPI